MPSRILTVADYLKLVNETLALIPSDEIVVVGEITDYRLSQGKWVNFDLKDEEEEAKISCFATTFKITQPLEDGMKVQITGFPKVYERFGKFSLNVTSVELVGEGALARAYELLKKKLADEGLFDPARKRLLPKFPSRIGLITSGEAAAYGDFLRILNNRWGGVEVVHIPVHVQGKNAVPEILGAFTQFNEMSADDRPELIVLTRGGGSLEDLHAFNDEQTARAVFSSSVPVVCGVGHERDESLCDFVADVRASTPTNAAELVVPDRGEISRGIDMSAERMSDLLSMKIDRQNRDIEHSVSVFDRFFDVKIHEFMMTIANFSHSFERYLLHLASKKQALISLTRLFENFDVKKVLERGFSITRSKNKIIRDPKLLAPGAELQIQLAHGSIEAQVQSNRQQDKLL
ncbi:MAG: exodeoxyribonuclease VII large subunit [Patescibacteria group bacterium]